ncbi:MAG: NAD-glutamate dehydrogenase, partial [Alphaproteobacteria bacterium]|nr:NAD-glutamate dehydrogenase [Alphaproteobacteria bacterium]
TVLARIADTGADASRLAEAFLAAWDVFALGGLIDEIDALDAKIAGATQLELYAEVQGFLVSRVAWFLRNVDFSGGLGPVVARFRAGVEILAGISAMICPQAMREAMTQRGEDLERRGVPRMIAMRIALQDASAASPQIVLVSLEANQEIAKVGETFFAADQAFGLGALMHAAGKLAIADYYDRLALDAALGQIEAARRRLTACIVAASAASDLVGSAAVERWIERGGAAVARIRDALAEVTAGGLTLARVVVAAGLANALAPADPAALPR